MYLYITVLQILFTLNYVDSFYFYQKSILFFIKLHFINETSVEFLNWVQNYIVYSITCTITIIRTIALGYITVIGKDNHIIDPKRGIFV